MYVCLYLCIYVCIQVYVQEYANNGTLEFYHKFIDSSWNFREDINGFNRHKIIEYLSLSARAEILKITCKTKRLNHDIHIEKLEIYLQTPRGWIKTKRTETGHRFCLRKEALVIRIWTTSKQEITFAEFWLASGTIKVLYRFIQVLSKII